VSTVVGQDPRTGQPVGGGVPHTTPADLDRVVAAAAAAAPVLAALAPVHRAGLLTGLADALDLAVEQLVPLAMAETGLGRPRLVGEVARTSFQLRLMATAVLEGSMVEAVLDSADPAAAPAPRPDLRRMLVPIGPVLVFSASNFPFAFSTLGGDTASALAAGCPVVVKAHEGHPELTARCTALAREVISDLGLPAGTFDAVYGSESGSAAVQHPGISACGFTGSAVGGRALFDLANQRPDPIPFYGELGSINPTVVSPDALAARGDDIAAGYVGSFTMGNGQFCTKPGLLFMPTGHGLDGRLRELVGEVDSAPMLTERVRSAFDTGVGSLADRPSVRVIAAPDASSARPGQWAAPSLLATTASQWSSDVEALSNECFGPVSLIVEYESAAELVEALSLLEGSLTATVHAEPDDGLPLADLLGVLDRRAGRVIWNGWPTGVAVAWAMQHGGPHPVTTNPLHTSVGVTATRRWLRPVSYQSVPDTLLPPALREDNPLGIPRRVDGVLALP
jgi:acyl-CoA reductase-like NAD-dependent aldehyde dehydrogenase